MLPGTGNGNVDRARRFLDGSPGGDCLRPDRKPHPGQIPDVTNSGIDDQPPAAPGSCRCCKQVAEIAGIGWGGGGEDQDVAGFDMFDGNVQHPVVTRRSKYGDGASADAGTGPDRSHVAGEQARAPLRLMGGRDAASCKRVDHFLRCPVDLPNHYAHHRIDRLESLGISARPAASLTAGITPEMIAAVLGQIGVVVPQMALAFHALDCGTLLVPCIGDIEEGVGLPAHLFGLVRLEQGELRRSQDPFAGIVPPGPGQSFLPRW